MGRFLKAMASASDSAARPGACRTPPGALYAESGKEEYSPFTWVASHAADRRGVAKGDGRRLQFPHGEGGDPGLRAPPGRVMYYALISFLKADMTSIDQLRRKYDPTVDLIEPHLTVVFPVPESLGKRELVNSPNRCHAIRQNLLPCQRCLNPCTGWRWRRRAPCCRGWCSR